MVESCACFGPRHSPYSIYAAAVGTIFYVFSYDTVLAGIRDRKPGHKLGLGLVLKGIMQLLPFA